MFRFFIPFIIWLCPLLVKSQAPIPLWETTHPNASHFIDMVVLPDGNLVASGNNQYIVSGQYPSRYAKYSINGSLIWQKNGRNLWTGEQDIHYAGNGKLILAATKFNTNDPSVQNRADTFLQQIDAATGDTTNTWAQTYATPQEIDRAVEMVIMPNGDIVTAGMTHYYQDSLQMNYFFLRRTDSLGNELWHRLFAKEYNTYGTRLLLNNTGNFILGGSNTRASSTAIHTYLMEISPDGDSLRGKSVIISNINVKDQISRFHNNIIQTSDGNYVFTGMVHVNTAYRGMVAKTDQEFNLLWYYLDAPTTGSGAFSNSVKVHELTDGTLLFLGYDNFQPPYLTRISATGQFISRTYLTAPGSLQCPVQPYDWVLLPDNSIVFCGWCLGSNQAYIGRWGNLNLGPVSAPEELQEAKSAVLGQSYPNPGLNEVSIPYTLPEGAINPEVKLTDPVTGRLVASASVPIDREKGEITISVANLSSGLYLYTLTVDGRPIGTRKLVVLK